MKTRDTAQDSEAGVGVTVGHARSKENGTPHLPERLQREHGPADP